jgi:hypothetical protein
MGAVEASSENHEDHLMMLICEQLMLDWAKPQAT